MDAINPSKALKISELVNNIEIDSYKWLPELINDRILKTTKHVPPIPVLIGEKEKKLISNLRVYLDLNNLEKYIKKNKVKSWFNSIYIPSPSLYFFLDRLYLWASSISSMAAPIYH